jgi:NTP pyrophosphatase (non-canonical NTP hydrolase)
MFEDLTREQITKKAQEITQELLQRMLAFTRETGCVIQAIEIETKEEPIGETGLSNIRQMVQAHFTVPAGHPAYQKEARNADN